MKWLPLPPEVMDAIRATLTDDLTGVHNNFIRAFIYGGPQRGVVDQPHQLQAVAPWGPDVAVGAVKFCPES